MAGSPATLEYNEAGDTDSSRRTKHLVGSWPSPNAQDGAKGGPGQGEDRLPGMAAAVWPTPKESNTTGAGTMGMGGDNLQTVAGWQSPNVVDAQGRGYTYQNGDHSKPFLCLPGQAQQAGWASPSSTDHKGAPAKPYLERGGGLKGHRLDSEVVHRGPMLIGSPVEIRSNGQLNPAFSLWLMGYPTGWVFSGVLATPSSRKSPRRSSKPTWRIYEGIAYEPPG